MQRRTNQTRKQGPRRGRDQSPQHRGRRLLFESESDAAPMTEPALKCIAFAEEGGRMAWACYDESKNEILVDDLLSHHADDQEAAINGFMTVLSPNLILIGAKTAANAALVDFLTSCGQAQPSDGHSSTGIIPYKILKSCAFDLRHCKNLILTKLRILTLFRTQVGMENQGRHMGSSNNTSEYHSIASVIDFDSTVLIRAIGALLNYLQGTLFRMEEGSTVTINNLRYLPSRRFMRIDFNTLNALHIFHTEHHPVMAKGQSHTKEGFSLFALLDRTKSKMGRQCLKDLMLRPLLDPMEIIKRQDVVSLFVDSERVASCISAMDELLPKVGAVDKIILRMQKCHSNPMDFLHLTRTLEAAIQICSVLENDLKITIAHGMPAVITGYNHGPVTVQNVSSNELEWINSLLERCHAIILHDLLKRITSIVDLEATALKKEAVVIQFGFHEALDNAKDAFDRLDDTLSAVGIDVLNKYPMLKELKVVFLPQVGFLVSIDKRSHRHSMTTNRFPDLPQELEFVFLQGDEAFFKTPDMRQLDDEIGDLDAYIKDTEAMIVNELEEDILECETELRSTFEALGELDCMLSLAGCARDFGYVRPEIFEHRQGIDENGYEIINGRHPLQELITDDDYIPNNTIIDEIRRINILTGPNYSGKSTNMRQIGVLVYMAHLGSFLPCERARIPITDQIMSQITCAETCAVPQSSFQRDLTRMGSILRRSTPRSLILMDEFGKGTAPASGIAVLVSALRKLANKGCKVVCATHFLEIFSLGLLQDGLNGIKALQMTVHLPESDEDDAVPLFQLAEGVSKTSAGLVCAKMANLSTSVIRRAHEIINSMKNGGTVSAIPSAMNANSAFQPIAQMTLRHVLAVSSWNDASELELETLKRNIMSM